MVLCVLFVLACCLGFATTPGIRYAPGELLVTYVPMATQGTGNVRSGGDLLLEAAGQHGLKKANKLVGLDPGKKRVAGIQQHGQAGMPVLQEEVAHLVFPADANLGAIIEELKSVPGVRVVERNELGSLAYVPNDTNYSQQQGDLALMGMESAWGVQQGSNSGVTVAVIDSGIDASHPDLSGAVDLANSYDFVNTVATTSTDDLGHGTRVAGIIGATGNNSQGIAGVAFGCKLLSLDVTDSSGTIGIPNVISAINYAVNHGASVINMSIRFSGVNTQLQDACDNAAANNVVLVAAAGNEGQGTSAVYPASYSSVIGVGALSDDGATRAGYSNYNGGSTKLVDLVAPGNTVYSTIPGNAYDGVYGSGTSFSTPFVSGVAALLRTKYPAQSAGAIKAQLKSTAVSLAASWLPGGSSGSGKVSASGALGTNMSPSISIGSVTVDDAVSISGSNNGDGTIDRGETVRLLIALQNLASDATTVTGTLATTSVDATVTSAGATWSPIANGGSATNGLTLQVTINALAAAAPIHFTLPISANSGAYTASLSFDLSLEAEITAPSNINTATTWTADNTYVLDGHVNVTKDLTIQPGTRIRAKRDSDMEILGGNFSAQGTTTQPVQFLSYEEDENKSLLDADLVWAKSVGSTGTDQVNAVATFSDGSVATAGTFSGAVTFGSSPSTQVLSSNGLNDIFVAKYSANGTLLWARQAGAANSGGVEAGTSLVALSDGGVVIGGNFSGAGTATFNSAPPIILAGVSTVNNAFYARYSSNGSALWAKQINAPGSSQLNGLAALTNGDIGACGSFNGPYGVFGAGEANETTFTAGIFTDACILRFGVNDGSLIWAAQISGPQSKQALSIGMIPDGTGQIVIGGFFGGTATFSNSPLIQLTNAPGSAQAVPDMFIARYSSSGAALWARRGGGSYADRAFDVGTAQDGSCYITGSFKSGITVAATFADPTTTISLFSIAPTDTNQAPNDVFIAKYTAAGNIVWVKSAGGTGTDGGNGIDVQSDGSFALVGYCQDSCVFGSAEPRQVSVSTISGSIDAFVAEYTSDGFFSSVKTWGTFNEDQALAVARAPDRSLIVGGWFNLSGAVSNTMTIGANEPNVTVLTSNGDYDGFLAKFSGSLGWDGLKIDSSAGSASLSNCTFERGGVVNNNPNATFVNCAFNRSGKDGLLSTAGTATVSGCTADTNRLGGLVIGARSALNSTAISNRQLGISSSAALTNCVASGDWGDGLTGAGMTSCTAVSGKARGLVSSGAVTGSLARSNSGIGVVCTSGNVTSATAESNGALGISISGGGTASACVARQNGNGGISTNGSTVSGCTAENNVGTGVAGSGASTASNCTVLGNTSAMTGVATVQNCAVTGNLNGGLSNASAVTGTYVAQNGGLAAAVDGEVMAVSDSTVIGNTAKGGVTTSGTLTNSWVYGNTGVGVDGNYAATVTSCTVQANTGGGVKNLGLSGITSSNLLANTGWDAFDDTTRVTTSTKNFSGNYWGTAARDLMTSFPFSPGVDIDPYILDGNDGAKGWFLDYSGFKTGLLSAPGSAAPAFLKSVTPNLALSAGSGTTTFTLVFSKVMNTGVNPTVTFGINSPYTLRLVSAAPGWTDSKTWVGVFGIDTLTGDGTNTLRVSGAKAADGFVIPDDTRNQFVVSGGWVVNNGIVIISSNSRARNEWSVNEKGPTVTGFNVWRQSAEFGGPAQQMNAALVPGSSFTDPGLPADALYVYWVDAVVQGRDGATSWTGVSLIKVNPENDTTVLDAAQHKFQWHTADRPNPTSGNAFNVLRSSSAAGPWSAPLNGATPLTGNQYTDLAGAATDYWYKVELVYPAFSVTDTVRWTDPMLMVSNASGVADWSVY